MGFLIELRSVNTYFADRKDPWEYAWIEFSGLRAKEILEGSGLSSDSPVYLPRTPQDGERLKNEILYLATHAQESSYHLIGHVYLYHGCTGQRIVFQAAHPGRQTCTVLHERSCDLHRPELFPCDHGQRTWLAAAIWIGVILARFSVMSSDSLHRNFSSSTVWKKLPNFSRSQIFLWARSAGRSAIPTNSIFPELSRIFMGFPPVLTAKITNSFRKIFTSSI